MDFKINYRLYSIILFGVAVLGSSLLLLPEMMDLMFALAGTIDIYHFMTLPFIASLLFIFNFLNKKLEVTYKIGISILSVFLGSFLLMNSITIIKNYNAENSILLIFFAGFGIWILSFVLLFIHQIKELNAKRLQSAIQDINRMKNQKYY